MQEEDGVSRGVHWRRYLALHFFSHRHHRFVGGPVPSRAPFDPLNQIDDDDLASEDDPINEHLGTIQADLTRGTKIGTGSSSFQSAVPNTGPVHERSKKAGSHRVK
jgi:hypothetical protein